MELASDDFSNALSDDLIYGNMCGITFKRKGTLGRDSDKCDFYFYRN